MQKDSLAFKYFLFLDLYFTITSGVLNFAMTRFFRYDLPSKGPCTEFPYPLGSEEYNVPQLQSSLARTPIPYPPYFYQHQHDSRKAYLAQRSNGDAENLSTSSPSKPATTRHSLFNGNLTSLQVDSDMSSRYDLWGVSAESPLGSTITEDDFLEMVWSSF